MDNNLEVMLIIHLADIVSSSNRTKILLAKTENN